MLDTFTCLDTAHLKDATHYILPDRSDKPLTLHAGAISVLTDHRLDSALVCHADKNIEETLGIMKERESNLLMVLNEDSKISGIISASDLSGDKPLTLAQHRRQNRSELIISDLMTPINQIATLPIQAILEHKVGDILKTLQALGTQYILVTSQQQGHTAIRGIFCATDIAKKLKIYFDPQPAPQNFMDITKALHGEVTI